MKYWYYLHLQRISVQTKSHRISTQIFVLTTGALWIWLSQGSLTQSAIPATIPRAGFQAPDFTLKSSSDNDVTLSELDGKVIILNFWASWCPPCRAEMPAFQRIYDNYSSNGIVILAVNAINQDTLENATLFTSALGITFPILLDEVGSVSNSYQIQSLPTTFLIDRNGIIDDVIIGGPIAEALLEVRIQTLLNKDSP